MSQGEATRQLIKIVGYYVDASLIERVVANLRKLLIDIDWIYGRRINEEGLYEIYLMVRKNPNLYAAILNLSKTVGIEKVVVFDGEYDERKLDEDNKTFIVYVPKSGKVKEYSWGVVNG
ncbi:MAG: hypothetical protein QW464_04205 [Ignisphaera sp.]